MNNPINKYFKLKEAEEGNVIAQYNLGVCYDKGQYVEQNYKEAIKWYRKAGEQGHEESQFNLGTFYYDGQGVEQDYKEAIKWFRKAAEQGHEESQFNLGVCYEENQDYKEAVKWFKKAADQGNTIAQLNFDKLKTQIKDEIKDEIATNDSEQCSVCLDNKKCIAFVPCGHITTCTKCSEKINNECPICKSYIENKLKIYY